MARTASLTKLQLWKERFEQLTVSNLTIQQFCESVGCTTATFYYWKRKIEADADLHGDEPRDQAPSFVPVVVRGTTSNSIHVRIKDGTRIVVPADAMGALQLVLQFAYRVA